MGEQVISKAEVLSDERFSPANKEKEDKMPNAAMDNLTKDSGDQQIREAISAEIELCMKTPPPAGAENHQKYCAGKAYGMAKEKAGRVPAAGR